MATGEQKKAVLLKLLDAGVVMLHLDARRPGVRVPPEFRNDGHLKLKVSLKYDGIQVLVDWYRVGASLSFSGKNYRCILPWDAIWGITHASMDGQVWPEDIPPDVVQVLAEKVEPEKPKPVPHLKIVH